MQGLLTPDINTTSNISNISPAEAFMLRVHAEALAALLVLSTPSQSGRKEEEQACHCVFVGLLPLLGGRYPPNLQTATTRLLLLLAKTRGMVCDGLLKVVGETMTVAVEGVSGGGGDDGDAPIASLPASSREYRQHTDERADLPPFSLEFEAVCHLALHLVGAGLASDALTGRLRSDTVCLWENGEEQGVRRAVRTVLLPALFPPTNTTTNTTTETCNNVSTAPLAVLGSALVRTWQSYVESTCNSGIASNVASGSAWDVRLFDCFALMCIYYPSLVGVEGVVEAAAAMARVK
jgi:hypothetical protein